MILLPLFFVILCSHGIIAFPEREVFIVHNGNNRDRDFALVVWREGGETACNHYHDRETIDLLESRPHQEIEASLQEMQDLMEECDGYGDGERSIDESQPQAAPENTETSTPDKQDTAGMKVIFPGTKWCGAGDKAKSYDDLGLHQDTDRCCRAHDLCDDIMAPGETKYNLTNKSPFTALSCQCDEDFYNCLTRINSMTSNTVGNAYFNVLRRPCYKKQYPKTSKCKKYRTFLKLTCLEYERDTSKPPVYEWVSAKTYKKIPFPIPLSVTIPF